MKNMYALKKPTPKIFYGWWIVLASIISGFYGTGVFHHGFTAFFNPIVKEFGWSRALTSIAFSIQRAESGISAPIVGWLITKYGPRKVMMVGAIIAGFGFIFLSQIQTLWGFYLAFLVMAIGISLATFLVSFITVGVWFQEMRGRALAIMSAGSAGLGGTLVPVIVWLITTYDWRTALVVVGIGFWIVVIPMSLIMRSKPEDYGYLPDGKLYNQNYSKSDLQNSPSNQTQMQEVELSFKKALKSITFWRLSLTLSFGWMLLSTISVHQIPALISFGITDQVGGLVVMMVTLVSVIGRLVGGFLGDYIDRRFILALGYSLQLIGILIFSNISDTWQVIPYILFFGFGYGCTIPVAFATLAAYFGRNNFSRILSMTVTISTFFGMTAPVFAGWIFDTTDSHRPAFILISFTLIPSLILILTTRKTGEFSD